MSDFRITLNTLYRTSGTDSNAVFQLPQRSVGRMGGRVSIGTVIIPITMLDIPTSHNTLKIVEGATTLTTSITAGNYDGYSLADELAAVMTAVSAASGAAATYTAAYDESAMKITIDTDGPNFYIHSGTSSKVQRAIGAYTSTAGSLTFSGGSAAASWTSTSCVQINPNALYLFSTLAPTSYVAGRGSQNIAAVIPISVPQGGLQTYEVNTSFDFSNYPSEARFWIERDDLPGSSVDLNGHQMTIYINFRELDENS